MDLLALRLIYGRGEGNLGLTLKQIIEGPSGEISELKSIVNGGNV